MMIRVELIARTTIPSEGDTTEFVLGEGNFERVEQSAVGIPQLLRAIADEFERCDTDELL